MPLIVIKTIPEASKIGKTGFFVVPVFGSTPQLTSLISIVCDTLPESFGIAVFDDATPNFEELLESISEGIEGSQRDVLLVKSESNKGFVANVNSAFEQLNGLDVIVCNSDIIPAYNWYWPLFQAAKSSPLVASATSQTNSGSIATIDFPKPADDFLQDLNNFGRKLASHGSYYPSLPTCVGHLMYLNAHALSVVGMFDETFSPGYCEEVDWSQRAIRFGFRHVLATGSLTYHFGSQTFDRIGLEQRVKLQLEHEEIIAQRYPNFHESISAFTVSNRSQLVSTQLAAKSSAGKLHLRLDFTDIGPAYTGTGRVAIEMAKRISKNHLICELDVIIESKDHLKFFKDELGANLEFFEFAEIESIKRADVVFRPMQVRSEYDLVKLFQMAHRQIVHQLDFIAYENLSYFDSASEWNKYRGVTDLAYALCDEITYLSEFVRDQSVSLGLSSRSSGQGTVIYAGTDHAGAAAKLDKHIDRCELNGAKPCKNDILVVGAAFAHKNRVFALRILNELITEHEFNGKLFLVGPNPNHGSSLNDEAEFITRNNHLRNHVTTLPWVSDELLVEMIESVGLVLYPTTSEGFGLVPFEAASLGTPCLATRAGSLGETLASVDDQIDLASVATSAATIKALLGDQKQSNYLLRQIKQVGSNFLWDDVVNNLYGAVEKVALTPPLSIKDQLWDKFLLNFLSNQEKRLNSEAHERNLVEADLNHQHKLSNSTSYRMRHSKLGKIFVPPGSIRDQVIQLTLRKILGVRKFMFGKL